MSIKTDKTKFYGVTIVCVSGGKTYVSTWTHLYLTLGEAAKAVADHVNETLLMDKREANVKADDCTKGYSLVANGGQLSITITAFDRPWSVQYMDCDNMEHSVELFPDKESAEIAVAKKAKAGIKELGYDTPEYIYADRNGDCEIESKKIKKSEPYIKVDTIGGNHIDWTAKQI